MKNDSKWKIAYTRSQKVMEAMTVVVLVSSVLWLMASWSGLPAKIPTHFGFTGEADAWGSKSNLIALPIVNICMYVLLTTLNFFPNIWNVPVFVTDENRIGVYQITRSLLIFIKLIVTCLFSYITFASTNGNSLGVPFTFVTLGATFGSIFYYILKIKKYAKNFNIQK